MKQTDYTSERRRARAIKLANFQDTLPIEQFDRKYRLEPAKNNTKVPPKIAAKYVHTIRTRSALSHRGPTNFPGSPTLGYHD